MPKVRVQAAPRTDFPGWWALGKSGRFNLDSSKLEEPTSGIFFGNGVPVDLEVTDAELAELQGPPNNEFLVVMVLPDDSPAKNSADLRAERAEGERARLAAQGIPWLRG